MNKVYVGNLPFKVTIEDLKNFFNHCGEIMKVSIVKDRATGKSKGFGFVEFKTQDGANSAITLNGKELQGRALRINIARERTGTERAS